MRRIIVVGCQGSGKTSLALRLGRNLGLPVVHLDVLYWRPKYGAEIPVVRLRSDREIEDFLAAISPAT